MRYRVKFLQIIMACFVFALAACNNNLTPAVVTKGMADRRDVGESAHELVGSGKYTRLAVEIQFAPGMQPQERSVNNLAGFLKTYTNKPGGITVTLKQVASIHKSKLTTQDADSFALKNRVLYTGAGLITLYIYFADAISASSWIGGIAFRNTSIIVFEKAIQDNGKGSGTANLVKMETAVMEHEAGHLLGLVNNGTAMLTPHEDAAHKFHCRNRNCLMYHAMEGSGLMDIPGNAVPVLDASCSNDLTAIRNK